MPMTFTQRPLRHRLSLREHSLMSEGTRARGASQPCSGHQLAPTPAHPNRGLSHWSKGAAK